MALQIIDYSRAPLLDSPAKNIFENVLKGYQMSQEPAKMKQEASAREMANALRKLEVEHKPKQYELSDQGAALANALKSKALSHIDKQYSLSDALQEARIQKAKSAPAAAVKVNGMVANFMATHPNATQEDITQFADKVAESQLAHAEAITNRSKDMTFGSSFDKLPINDKKQTVALFKGMGVDPVQAVSLARNGTTPSEYAQQNNIDITQVEPDYAAGEQNIKMAQQANAYMDEIDKLDKHINDGLGKYQNKILGYSLEQIADAAEGSNPDQQAKALAARALLPELNSLRLKIAGGNVGIEALRELEHKSLGKLNVFEGLIDSNTYTKAQKYMDKWIKEAGKVRVNSLVNNSMLKKHLKKGTQQESSMGEDPLGLF